MSSRVGTAPIVDGSLRSIRDVMLVRAAAASTITAAASHHRVKIAHASDILWRTRTA
jgi:hypothetical protein